MMAKRVRWGVLGAAKIAVEKVILAMQKGEWCEVAAIASRDVDRARAAAERLGIAKAYGSYDELLADPEIDAVYNPLPNHLHLPLSIRAVEAGKHVLCEKPIGLDTAEAIALAEARDRTGVKVQEAFMVRTHPQWLRAKEIAASGRLGEVRSIAGYFSYYNDDPSNIRSVPEYGGGALMDIGCYLVLAARTIFGEEPSRVFGAVERDAKMGVDVLTSAILSFGARHAIFTCSTRVAPYQRVQILGTRARLEIEVPFNAPPDRSCRLFVDDGSDLQGASVETVELPTVDQYTIQGDLFSRAILEDTDVAYPLEESIRNMAVVEAIFASGRSGAWEMVA
jgi:predicted dehydrogenase